MRIPIDNSNARSRTAPCFRGFTVRTAMPPPLKFVRRACCSAFPSFNITGRFTACRKYLRFSRTRRSFEMVRCITTLSSVNGLRNRKFAPTARICEDSFAFTRHAKITALLFEVPLRVDSMRPSAPGTSISTNTPSIFLRFRHSRASCAVGTKTNFAPNFFTPLATACIVA